MCLTLVRKVNNPAPSRLVAEMVYKRLTVRV